MGNWALHANSGKLGPSFWGAQFGRENIRGPVFLESVCTIHLNILGNSSVRKYRKSAGVKKRWKCNRSQNTNSTNSCTYETKIASSTSKGRGCPPTMTCSRESSSECFLERSSECSLEYYLMSLSNATLWCHSLFWWKSKRDLRRRKCCDQTG